MKHGPVILIGGSTATQLGDATDRGCVACGTIYIPTDADGTESSLVVDARGRYWCLDCAIAGLANVRRRSDERDDYKYPWTFAETGGLSGQHASVTVDPRAAWSNPKSAPAHPIQCPKCSFISGDDWRQCNGSCPMPASPHFTRACAARFVALSPAHVGTQRTLRTPATDGSGDVLVQTFEDVNLGAAGADIVRTVRLVAAHIERPPDFTYRQLANGLAQTSCTCGWTEDPMPVSPFDPAEALAAAAAQHPKCKVPL